MTTARATAMRANTGYQHWITPPHILDAARAFYVHEGIDLDPASSDVANRRVGARRFYTLDTDGLARPWHARNIWLNPPYARGEVGKWLDKAIEEYGSGHYVEALILTNAATDASYIQRLAAASTAHCMLSGRVQFEREMPDGSIEPAKRGANMQGQIVWYIGEDRQDWFGVCFAELGVCWWR